jgi:hypothetical protein
VTLWTFLKGTPVVVVKPIASVFGNYEAWVERRWSIVEGTIVYSDDPQDAKTRALALFKSLQPERLDEQQ